MGSRSHTPRQLRWAENYPIDLNATQAAIRAGYASRSAKQQGHVNMTNHDLMEIARGHMDARSKRTEITADWVLQELVRNYNRAMEGTEEVAMILGDDGPEIQGIGTFRYNGAVANKALEHIGKHLGMFNEKGDELPSCREHVPLMTDAQIQRLGDIPGVPPMKDITPRKH